MCNMKFFKRLLMPFYKRFETVVLLYPTYRYLLKYFGRFAYSKDDKEVLRSSIVLQCHIIEKGLSLKNVRPGFGVPKMNHLLDSLGEYIKKYHDEQLEMFAMSIVKAYFDFNEKCGTIDDGLKAKYENLCTQIEHHEKYDYLCGGAVHVTKEEILKAAMIPYLEFVKARHSVRHFTGEPVDEYLLHKALEMAQYTPSACNRQPWKVFVYTQKENVVQLLTMQTGARQFLNDVGAVIIVTSSATHFFGNEMHQLYLNGGLYSMNLLLALHAVGLGSIPLNLGISDDKLKLIKNFANIPESEVPVLLIAVGNIPKELKVAASKRFCYTDYTIFD